MEEAGEEEEEESRLIWATPEADCYSVMPAHSSAEGTYSGSWGRENFLATVALEIHVQGDKSRLVLLREKEIFAEVNVGVPLEKYVEDVLDSSRYVVLRIADREHPGRVAIIGMGFTDRTVAFDFKTTPEGQ